MSRVVIHMDMDAFFAAIEEREDPKLKGKGVVIGADPKGGSGRGVVSTANYEARKYGIGSAMPISKAWKLCPSPKCVYLPGDMKLYGIISERIMGVVKDCVGNAPIEQTSVDEAYVEVYDESCKSKTCFKEAEALAKKIQSEIKKRERLTCSIGIGPNKAIAKIASDFKKPNGITVVRLDEVQEFLDPLPVRRLRGIGSKAESELLKQGIKTVEDLRLSLPKSDDLYNSAHGIDNNPIVEWHDPKSMSRDTTFEQDINDQALLTKVLIGLCDRVWSDVQSEAFEFKTITVRVRFSDFKTHTSSHTIKEHTRSKAVLRKEAIRLLFPYFRKKRFIRLLGVRVSKLRQ